MITIGYTVINEIKNFINSIHIYKNKHNDLLISNLLENIKSITILRILLAIKSITHYKNNKFQNDSL